MPTPNKTLIIRLSSIGDIVLASPLLRVLRKKFPSSQIDFVTRKEYADLIRYNPNINVTFEFDATQGFKGLRYLKEKIRREQYDLVLDIHNNIRSRYLRCTVGADDVITINKRVIARTILVKFKKNYYRDIVSVADRYIEPLQKYTIEKDTKGVELYIPDNIIFAVSRRMAIFELDRYKKIIGFCPSAKHSTKRWPQERFIETGIRLARELDAKILVFGGTMDKSMCSYIVQSINEASAAKPAADLSGEFSLLETAAAMHFCDVVVTNDSGLMHIASAMKKKIVALFGSTVKEFGFFPIGERHVVLERKGLYCRPCSHIGLSECPEKHFKCMTDIQVAEVVQAVTSFSS